MATRDEPWVEVLEAGRTIRLTSGDLIGRSRRATLRIEDPMVSEYHATVSSREEGLVVLPLRGGVFFLGDPVGDDGHVLQPGQILELGWSFDPLARRIPLTVHAVHRAAEQLLVGLAPAPLLLSDDDNLLVHLCEEPPFFRAEPPGPRLFRVGSAVMVDDGARRLQLTSDEVMVRFRRGSRLLHLRERPRDAFPRTVRDSPLHIEVRGEELKDRKVRVRDLARPWRGVITLSGLPGSFLAEVLVQWSRTRAPVPKSAASSVIWEKNHDQSSRQALLTLRKQLGSYAELVQTLRGEDVALQINLPAGSTLDLPGETSQPAQV